MTLAVVAATAGSVLSKPTMTSLVLGTGLTVTFERKLLTIPLSISPFPRTNPAGTAELEAVREEMAALRHHVAELEERQDFAERLLAQARERGLLAGPPSKD